MRDSTFWALIAVLPACAGSPPDPADDVADTSADLETLPPGTAVWIETEPNAMAGGDVVSGADGSLYYAATTPENWQPGDPQNTGEAIETDIAILRYDIHGTLVAWKTFHGSDQEFVGSFAIDDAGDLYLGGRGAQSFGCQDSGGDTPFVAKLDGETFACMWLRRSAA